MILDTTASQYEFNSYFFNAMKAQKISKKYFRTSKRSLSGSEFQTREHGELMSKVQAVVRERKKLYAENRKRAKEVVEPQNGILAGFS